jgi:hypothetical protein
MMITVLAPVDGGCASKNARRNSLAVMVNVKEPRAAGPQAAQAGRWVVIDVNFIELDVDSNFNLKLNGGAFISHAGGRFGLYSLPHAECTSDRRRQVGGDSTDH